MKDPISRLNAALEGRYRVDREIGRGGMAMVYLAEDLRHGRKVALKVLKPELAAAVGSDRFLAEIRTTANLQHPNILPLYESGEADHFLYYTMPYVERETLRDRLERDTQLPVEEAVRIARNMAEALDYAHRRGVIHRDIKPANVMLLDGKPAISDFGIALAVDVAGGGRLTETGLSLGTPQYMSPEQATGDANIGPPTDTYALGCVLYEMLVGEPPYSGPNPQAILGQILTGEAISATRRRTPVPPNVDGAIRKALEKVPADRFATTKDFAQALSDPGFRYDPLESVVGVGRRWRAAAYAGWGLTAALAVAMAWGPRGSGEPSRDVERFSAPFEAGQEMRLTNPSAFELSPDGSVLVYRHNPLDDDALSRLMVRRWSELQSVPVGDSEGGLQPSVSPDGTQLAFVQGDEIRVADLDGGTPRTLVRGAEPLWGQDGYIYASDELGTYRILQEGGLPERLTEIQEGEAYHTITDLLPGAREALVMVSLVGASDEIHVLDLASGEMEPLLQGTWARYADSGHLVYLDGGSLIGASYDVGRHEVGVSRVPLFETVEGFSLSDDGKLFYSRTLGGGATLRQIVRVGRDGSVAPVDPDWVFDRGDPNQGWSLSQDGSQLAIRELTADGYDIYVKQLDSGPRSRITFDEAEERKPVWSPDGRMVTFVSERNGEFDVWTAAADGTGSPQLVLDFDAPVAETVWSPSGDWLVLRTAGAGGQIGGRDIYAVRSEGNAEPVPLMAAEYDEIDPDISPNGRWIAYASNETNRYEVLVRPFPDVESGRWQVSTQGGRGPRWSRSGTELFFLDGSGDMVSVAVEGASEGSEFSYAPPQPLFSLPGGVDVSDISVEYVVSADDSAFLMSFWYPGLGEGLGRGPVLVNNFFEELRSLIPE